MNPLSAPRPVWAGQFALNGNGEMTGPHWINDAGYFIGPVVATLLWIPATFILLLPQYRPVDQDPNRPI